MSMQGVALEAALFEQNKQGPHDKAMQGGYVYGVCMWTVLHCYGEELSSL